MTPKQFARFVVQKIPRGYRLDAFTTAELEEAVGGFFPVDDPNTALYFQILRQAKSFVVDQFWEHVKGRLRNHTEEDVKEAYWALCSALEKAVDDPTLYQELKKQ